MSAINFRNLPVSNKPNQYLVCPQDYCSYQPKQLSPTYKVSLVQLERAWQNMIKQQPRVTLIHEIPKEHHYTYIQRTRWLRFPDYIDVKLIQLSAHDTTLAIYSRSKYGYYDFGVNQHRIEQWLAQLQTMLIAAPSKIESF
ncbi:MAG: hypothetical protein Tsb005_16680 [Gammaproteobacteria bacterium]